MGYRVKRKKTSPTRPAASGDSRTRNDRLIASVVCILLAGIVWIAFGQTLHHQFVNYDDGSYVYANPRITSGLTLDNVKWAFTHFRAGNWQPLTAIWHMLDCQLYGLQPWGHHLTNILLHAAAAILLFFALRELTGGGHAAAGIGSSAVASAKADDAGRDQRSRLQPRDAFWASAFVATLFAIHPLRVEPVAWVSGRGDVLSGMFFMLTLLAYARYARSDRLSLGRYATVLVLFALGLMCKPTLVTVPFVLLLLDYWPLGRIQSSSTLDGGIKRNTWTWLVVEKLPLFVLSAASCVATVTAQKQALDASLKPPLAERVGNALVSYVTYVGQMIWPAR